MSKIRWVNCAFLRSQDLQFSQNIYPLQLDLPNARPKKAKKIQNLSCSGLWAIYLEVHECACGVQGNQLQNLRSRIDTEGAI